MPKQFSGREVVKRLTRLGYIVTSQRGSHLKMHSKSDSKVRTVIVPMHKQIAHGTLKSILSQAGISKEMLDEAK